MTRFSTLSTVLVGLLLISIKPSFAQTCPGNMARIGLLCVDKYEAIVRSYREMEEGGISLFL